MFRRMVVLGPTRFTDATKQAFLASAGEVAYDAAVPRDDEALIRAIGDADALLVTLEVRVGAAVLSACPRLVYIGMCCSLYSPESANVDIHAARARGITVTGIRDYGDEGVVEYVISELVQLLHGFREHMWRPEPTELTGMRCGILGMGTLGTRISQALRFFGAEVSYYSRTRKPDVEARG
ncbi:dihydrofolate reductase, partial [Eubacteriales bacterium OttesenSCG-928-A19]|nr:dihydrofolate reductase [Eubacteriales bacterium OttesenSCG-928-A19]